MNALVLLANKLRLTAQYADGGADQRAVQGMADVNDVLTRSVEQIMGYKLTHPACGIDEAALLGSLQLVLEAMQKNDMPALSAALKEGLIPEIERAERAGAAVDTGDKSDLSLSEEARLQDIGGAAVVCLFGYGDGAYYNELCAKAPEGSTFIVYEPETDNVIDLREELVKSIDFYRLDSTVILATPGYDTVFAGEYADFVREINANRERVLVNKNTLKRFRDDAAKNVITNLHILGRCNLVGELSAILPREVPVIIVSAGPSLDKNIEQLKRAKGHSLIFAVDTAMKYLMQHDIMPDLGITVEPIKPMANYEDDRCFDVPHIFDCESNPEIVSRERERIFIYNCRDYVKRLLEGAGVDVEPDVPSGGSVATAAFAVCYQLQMKTIILIGQDLAYSGTSTHAGGVESAGINGDIGTELVDGIDGGQVRTRSDWLGYQRWFENAIRTINEQKLDMTVVDATEGGALIHGSRVMTLADAIEKYCSGCDYAFTDELKKLPYLLDDEEYAEVRESIKDSFEELKAVRDAAGSAAQLCESIIAGNAVPDTARRELAGYRRTCESALLYPLINNYAVSDIADEVNTLRQSSNDPLSEIRQQKLAFDAIAGACDYFEKLRPE
ncbi:MAG: motility associated factor glycosyltransferase family protein [Lachnospiraceae bacterium]|nr:motility associated factor glycosyltransferase family protein [Lachnospiraceae bacterium]